MPAHTYAHIARLCVLWLVWPLENRTHHLAGQKNGQNKHSLLPAQCVWTVFEHRFWLGEEMDTEWISRCYLLSSPVLLFGSRLPVLLIGPVRTISYYRGHISATVSSG
uniref:Secreted protein n=1 Tax=Rhipicephalus zambeziensis TaxID=60191 RepID=A0A224YLL5_9ACAR